jgi:hypothetical protein
VLENNINHILKPRGFSHENFFGWDENGSIKVAHRKRELIELS